MTYSEEIAELQEKLKEVGATINQASLLGGFGRSTWFRVKNEEKSATERTMNAIRKGVALAIEAKKASD